MVKPDEQVGTAQKIKDKLSQIIIAIRIPLWISLAVVVVGISGYFIYTEVSKKNREESTILAENAADKYAQWIAEEDEQKKSTVEKKLRSDLDVIIRAYPRQNAAQRALLMRGNLAFENEGWKTAEEDYSRLAESFPKSYLAGEALFKAAICQEEMESIDRALEYYSRFVELYPRLPRVPHALFSIGRLQEKKQDFEAAALAYNNLKLDYSTSNWTNLATSRIITLKYEGKIEE